ncbi:hypothetical protein GF339_08025 [candidate division KSB3 bacterium]|uniref:Uncharacterized protein n=1 Tax=candidate division KSB3 bacterium TaxID=2044937 RepID=A0A9D5JV63_9BACT|nr:hypothetical protein [candidate division KSB3 bacterium]MBD3324517.1 hypothetical protein [candidate division KSB3 bacterium]
MITTIHARQYPSDNPALLKNIYRDSLRRILTHPELTLFFLQSFPANHPLLPRRNHQEYLGLMLEGIYGWEDRFDRLRALHGDFWGPNLCFTDESAALLDDSRIPWGDPGMDIGGWMVQYVKFYHQTGNPYFQELGETFLTLYEERTHDTEIRRALCLPMGFLGVVNLTPLLPCDLDEAARGTFLQAIYAMLRTQTFTWT